jgi:hypothetical protein
MNFCIGHGVSLPPQSAAGAAAAVSGFGTAGFGGAGFAAATLALAVGAGAEEAAVATTIGEVTGSTIVVFGSGGSGAVSGSAGGEVSAA